MGTHIWRGSASFGVALAVCAIGLGMASAQAPTAQTPLIKQTFEEDDGAWQMFGNGGKISVTHEATHVHEGKAALQFDYNVKKGEMSALMLPTPAGKLTKAKSFRFFVQADTTSPLAIVLQEHDGGRYMANFVAPKEKWQPVELSISDFILSEDMNDPKDPNFKLDLDQVEGIGITDIGQMFAQTDNEAFLKLLNLQTGPHTLYLDDFAVSEEALPSVFTGSATDVRLDTFARPQVGWMGVGNVKLSLATGKPLESRGLQADYHQAPMTVVGFVRRIPRGRVNGTTKLAFDVAALKATKMLVQVEEKGGGKYNSVIDVPGGKVPTAMSLPFSEFKVADDSHDTNDKLDLDMVTQVLFMDLSGFLEMVDQDNTVWISPLKALVK